MNDNVDLISRLFNSLYDLRRNPEETENIIEDERGKSVEMKRKFLNFVDKLRRKNTERKRIKKKTKELKSSSIV
ncbi:hypothetical protein AKJ43_02895 [candidate division MSBL1 archaeon SCGC-AAA261D19]|uniref:Uncharacterized protein n=1 Tax=candidate division MSBL1 archaeon SCGC-AAA261D19 TaxID=1698273 RepID=A0A133V652_9EURY|nr:hypothetical protein AKJ43_02895 [candidate division MSBL1 archaeon SCGC-AAA261D19]